MPQEPGAFQFFSRPNSCTGKDFAHNGITTGMMLERVIRGMVG